MKRREFLKYGAALGAGTALLPYGKFAHASINGKKVLVLGLDGMDVGLTRTYLQQGLLPNLRKVIDVGGLHAMTTSDPPQSPVAWSNVIVGGTPAIHGIYDFIHRDPATMIPYLSTSQVTPPARMLHLGNYTIPLSKGSTENLQQGQPFWDFLTTQDIPTTLFKMPANFPCRGKGAEMVSGMGTPDLRGGYGNFTLFTTAPSQFNQDITGGRIIPTAFRNNHTKLLLPGPANTLKQGTPETVVPIDVWRDRTNSVVRILFQEHELILQEGDWSGWLQISFPLVDPLVKVKGISKIYIKQVHPHFSMYVSPINIDPSEPALPVVSSEKYGKLLTENAGLFYTQGFPEDTKALSEGIFTEAEYLELARQVLDERKRLLDFEFSRFQKLDQGMLFFYFSSLDQNSHMYWRAIDQQHPLYDPDLERDYGDTLKSMYSDVDTFLGDVLNQNDLNDPNFCLLIMSDHGFGTFRRQVNLNTWLYKQGYLALSNARGMEPDGYFTNVNWKRTGAYNLGINSIYLNLKGRERNGVVLENQAQGLRNSLRQELLELVDPATGRKAVSQVLIVPDSERKRHPHAPDLIVGWDAGYRTSWKSILGGLTPDVFADNLDKWSGDHCVASHLVPAILATNRQVTKSQPGLYDIAPTILEEFGILPSEEMEGSMLYHL